MKRTAAALAVFLLAGCGGGSAAAPSTPQALAQKIGCTDYQASGGQMLAREVGRCQLDGQAVYLHTFPDSTTRDQWLEVARVAGGVFAVGPDWAVQTFSGATTQVAAERLGGKVI